jgi:hypothetical protein
MIWVILAAVGVPLWLCAMGIYAVVFRNRSLRRREGDLPVRFRAQPGKRWHRGHAIWVHDVLAFRGSPAAWKEKLAWSVVVSTRVATPEETKGLRGLHRLGTAPLIARLQAVGGEPYELAVHAEHGAHLLGGHATTVGGVPKVGPV